MNSADWNARDAIKALVIAHVGPLAVIGACSLCAGGMLWALHQRDQANFRAGQLSELLRVADSTAKAERAKISAVTPVVEHDIKMVTRTVARVDTLRDSLIQHIHDTSYVIRYVAASDSVAHACRDLANSCDAFKASATKLIAAQDQKIHSLETMPAKPRRHCGLGGTLGYGVVKDSTWHVGPSLTAGIACSF